MTLQGTDWERSIPDPRDRDEIESQLLKATIVSDPADATVGVMVMIPSFDETHVHGPCYWQPRIVDDNTFAIPSNGDEALVALDEEGEPWVILWWPANPAS